MRVHVAAGVIVNERGEVLIARRASHLHQGGLWEFPGGKLNEGESPRQALCRELREELGIEVQHASRMLSLSHDYPDKSVLLEVWRVDVFTGEPHGREGQPLRWLHPTQLDVAEFPAANVPIIDALCNRG